MSEHLDKLRESLKAAAVNLRRFEREVTRNHCEHARPVDYLELQKAVREIVDITMPLFDGYIGAIDAYEEALARIAELEREVARRW